MNHLPREGRKYSTATMATITATTATTTDAVAAAETLELSKPLVSEREVFRIFQVAKKLTRLARLGEIPRQVALCCSAATSASYFAMAWDTTCSSANATSPGEASSSGSVRDDA